MQFYASLSDLGWWGCFICSIINQLGSYAQIKCLCASTQV